MEREMWGVLCNDQLRDGRQLSRVAVCFTCLKQKKRLLQHWKSNRNHAGKRISLLRRPPSRGKEPLEEFCKVQSQDFVIIIILGTWRKIIFWGRFHALLAEPNSECVCLVLLSLQSSPGKTKGALRERCSSRNLLTNCFLTARCMSRSKAAENFLCQCKNGCWLSANRATESLLISSTDLKNE